MRHLKNRQRFGYALLLQDFSFIMLEKYGKRFGSAALLPIFSAHLHDLQKRVFSRGFEVASEKVTDAVFSIHKPNKQWYTLSSLFYSAEYE
jgi:hypothetical protein